MKTIILMTIFLLLFTGCSTRHTTLQNNSQKTVHHKQKKSPQSNTTPSNTSYTLYSYYEQWKNTPYKMGGTTKRGVDCSGFIQALFKNVYHLHIPRTTKEQAYYGRGISKKSLREGDVLFFKTSWKVRHVGVYMHDGKFLHASTSKGVTISSIHSEYWRSHYYMSRRFIK